MLHQFPAHPKGAATAAYGPVTSDARLPQAPELPTFAEIGLPELSYAACYALFAPKGTPKEIIGRLNAATIQALADPAVQSRLANLGGKIFPTERQTPEAVGRDGQLRQHGEKNTENAAMPISAIT
jgi:tripartite-type tricarboxylate transporter receptor subunit TctC